MSNNEDWLPTEKQIKEFGLLKEMLQSQRKEFDPLSSKKPNEELNKMKIKMVNRVLEPLKKILEHEDSYQFLDTLTEDDIPTNSDVVLIISQYETGVQRFKDKYYLKDEFQSNYSRDVLRWMTREYPPDFYKNEESDE